MKQKRQTKVKKDSSQHQVSPVYTQTAKPYADAATTGGKKLLPPALKVKTDEPGGQTTNSVLSVQCASLPHHQSKAHKSDRPSCHYMSSLSLPGQV